MNDFKNSLRAELAVKGMPKDEEALIAFVRQFLTKFLKTQQTNEKSLQEVISLIEIINSEDDGEQGTISDSNGDKVSVEPKKAITAARLREILKQK